ncbi:MAG: heavy-metal-associated domain-containing protein [Acidobacteria bacterium]|nr:heavy-metal-associated domain-containing protein [Acidobacteriota bacterium]
MKKALEGLKGVANVERDLARDLFRVTPADGAAPSQEALFSAIRKLGYKPGLAEVSAFRSTPEPVHPARDVPDAVQKALDRAKPGGKKFVLVDCMGDD